VAALVGGYNLYSRTGAGPHVIAFQVVAIIVLNFRNAWFLLMGS